MNKTIIAMLLGAGVSSLWWGAAISGVTFAQGNDLYIPATLSSIIAGVWIAFETVKNWN